MKDQSLRRDKVFELLQEYRGIVQQILAGIKEQLDDIDDELCNAFPELPWPDYDTSTGPAETVLKTAYEAVVQAICEFDRQAYRAKTQAFRAYAMRRSILDKAKAEEFDREQEAAQ